MAERAMDTDGLRMALGGMNRGEFYALRNMLHAYGLPKATRDGQYPSAAVERWLSNHVFVQALCTAFRRGIAPLEPPFPALDLIYFVGFADYVKIGITSDLGKRINSLQTAVPHALAVYHVFLGEHREEARLHKQFRDYRLSGEWFRFSQQIRDWIEDEVGK